MIEYYKNLSLENLFYIDENGIVQEEEWRDIPNFVKLYQASNLGRIKSLSRICKHGYGGDKKIRERILSQSVSGDRYLGVALSKNGKKQQFLSQVLVAMAFLGHVPCGMKIEVDHVVNSRPKDNRLCNLQLLTHRVNSSKDKEGGSSRYVGVFYRKKHNHWRCCIKVNTKTIEIGTYKEESVAGKMYEIALENIDKYDGDNVKFRAFVKSLA